jgi:hypothetical protein
MSLKFDFSLRGSLLSPLLLWMVCMLGVNPLHAQAVQSLKLSPGVTGTFTVPSVSPFPTMGSSRVEMRIHDFTIPTQNTLLFETPVLRIELRPAGELCAQDTLDGMYSYGNYMCADITGKQDLTLRLQRNIQAGQLQFEVMETQTGAKIQTYCGTLQISGNGNLFHCPLAPVINGSWAGSGRVGGTTTNTRVACDSSGLELGRAYLVRPSRSGRLEFRGQWAGHTKPPAFDCDEHLDPQLPQQSQQLPIDARLSASSQNQYLRSP